MTAFLNAVRKFIEEFAPALAVMLWNYEEAKVGEANNEKTKAQLELQIEKNHEAVDQKYIGRDDFAILNDAIHNGGGTGQYSTDSSPNESTPSGNNTGSIKPPKGNA